MYGQSFLCITYAGLGAFDLLGEVLQYVAGHVYTSWVDSSLAANVPAFAAFAGGTYIKTAASVKRVMTSAGGASFTQFAKSDTWGEDLYASLVAPGLGDSLRVETWIRGSKLGPYCPPSYQYATVDVTNMVLGGVAFKETQDHSKWAITSGASAHAVCIGDINRMSSQFARGGGTVCVPNAQLWAALNGAIAATESC